MKLITRTITEKRYTVRCMEVNTCEVVDREFSLGSENPKTSEVALKMLQSKNNTDSFKLVAIIKVTTADALYAMTEQAFINAAIQVADLKAARDYFKANPDEVIET